MLPARAGRPVRARARGGGIDCRPARPAGDIRVNLTLTEPDGTTTKLNGPGAPVDAAHLDDLAETLVRSAAGGAWTVLAGSLPPDAPNGYYAELVARLRGVSRVAVDTSEGPLAALVDDLPGAAPDLLKPNAEELASVTGTDAAQLETDPGVAAKAARTLVDRGVGAVLATLGGPRRRTGRRRRRLVRAASPDDRGQHRGRRRLHALRLPAGRAARPLRARPARARGGLR